MRHIVQTHMDQALSRATAAGDLPPVTVPADAVERPRDTTHGDWASTVALKLARELGQNPLNIAQIIIRHLAEDDTFARVEVAGPGFINLTLSAAALASILREAFERSATYASTNLGEGRTINVEFISANPTGPMHVGHGRWAALGNALCNVLTHAGWTVCREFYVNDAGNQMDKFGESLAVRYLQECGEDATMPEDGYQGAYLVAIAKELASENMMGCSYCDAKPEFRSAVMREIGYKRMLEDQQRICSQLGVPFDVWFSERELYLDTSCSDRSWEWAPDADNSPQPNSPIARMMDRLRAGNYLYEKEGATWFRSTDFSDDKDRVLVKSDGSHTYFAPDIAYHLDKFERPAGGEYPKGGSEYLIDIWGADHHGYVPRMQAAVAALGHEGKLTVVLGQLVNLFRDGQPVRMSKRTGEMVTFEELVEEVGADATKYLMLSRSADQPIDFDIEVAKKQDATNPVYYVQYAHARICSVLRKAADAGLAIASLDTVGDDLLMLLGEEAEKDLIRFIGQLGELIEQCARDLTPYKLTHYAEELAARFHKFYTDCVIIGDEKELSLARLYLSETTRRVLTLVLGLLGVSAPEKM